MTFIEINSVYNEKRLVNVDSISYLELPSGPIGYYNIWFGDRQIHVSADEMNRIVSVLKDNGAQII